MVNAARYHFRNTPEENDVCISCLQELRDQSRESQGATQRPDWLDYGRGPGGAGLLIAVDSRNPPSKYTLLTQCCTFKGFEQGKCRETERNPLRY